LRNGGEGGRILARARPVRLHGRPGLPRTTATRYSPSAPIKRDVISRYWWTLPSAARPSSQLLVRGMRSVLTHFDWPTPTLMQKLERAMLLVGPGVARRQKRGSVLAAGHAGPAGSAVQDTDIPPCRQTKMPQNEVCQAERGKCPLGRVAESREKEARAKGRGARMGRSEGEGMRKRRRKCPQERARGRRPQTGGGARSVVRQHA